MSNSKKPVVFISEPIADCGLEILKDACEIAAPWQDSESVDEELLRSLFYEADASITRLFPLCGEDIRRCKRLKVIARHGVGYDMVDCETATELGIAVLNTPEANSNSVAEHTIAMLMAVAKEIGPSWKAVVSGNFGHRSKMDCVELANKTLGLIGLGRIGRRVAQIAISGLGMEVCAYDPFLDAKSYDGPVTIEEDLDELLARSDFLSMHVPLTRESRHLLNEERLQKVKPGCRVVNTSRGGVVDESALVRALESGTVSGAALDVFETEPVPADHPLCSAPNTILTPHTAAQSREAMENMARDSAQGVFDFLQGRRPQWVVNPEVLKEH